MIAPFKAVVSGFDALASIITSAFSVLSHLMTAFTSLTDAALKLTTGLFELGAAAAPGGLKAFAQVMEYATAVVGRVATPIFVALATAVLAIVRYFEGPLTAATLIVAEWIGVHMVDAISAIITAIEKAVAFFSEALPAAVKTTIAFFKDDIPDAFNTFVDSVYDSTDALVAFAKDLNEGARNAKSVLTVLFGSVTDMIDDANERNNREGQAGQLGPNAARRAAERAAKGEQFTGGGAGGDFGLVDSKAGKIADLIGQSMHDLLQAMRDAFAQQANVGYSGIADIHKTIQMQSFKGNIQADILNENIKTNGILNRMEQLLSKRGAAAGSALGP